ncbi:DUF58 domain-containing protein [Paraurantiacibacter namhicola]|uniref:VWA domain containing CoxE-like protein n=1 Tax=Paraurantiacibacter namhicola TaxID=645517 RepID=A0A1C7DBC7_9SPHN|nr:DUF58 domain-containing protein [Paraurantiacibacter namhicola]ANU08796.1 VWA domain containing CoxE-like protein [Paraurantiacibacter namhicola]
MRAPFVPTGLTLGLIVLAAPAAVLVAALAPQAWTAVPMAAVVLLALAALDAFLAGPLREWHMHLPDDAEVGQDLALAVSARIGARAPIGAPETSVAVDARLDDSGSVGGQMERAGEGDAWETSLALSPSQRGVAPVEAIWIRWRGPLGLAHRQFRSALEDREVRIWPDLSPVRSPLLQTYLRDAQFGLVAKRIRGDGTQFESLTEYEPGMDRRRIDWNASARHVQLLARENEAERDNQIVFAFDCGAAMSEDLEGLPRLDRAITAALTSAYVALKGGDRVSLFGFDARPQLSTPFVTDPRHFHRLQQAAAQLDYSAGEPNYTLALATLAANLKRRSLVVLFSDFSDSTSAEMMVESVERLVRRHVVLFVAMEDAELEGFSGAEPDTVGDVAGAVTADSLARQRAIVLTRLRHLGVDVIEAPYHAITYALLDRYMATKRRELIG